MKLTTIAALLSIFISPLPVSPATLAPSPSQVQAEAAKGQAWISSTGKRHNSGCRYYGKGKGHLTSNPAEGVACKICGG